MNNTLLEINIEKIDISDFDQANAVLNLQTLAYKKEAEEANVEQLPYLEYSLSALEKSINTFVGAYLEGKLVGVISFFITTSKTMDIHLFMIHPEHQRLGIGSRLLEYVQGNYPDVKKIIAQSGSKNYQAIDFYKKHGIHFVCNIQVNSSFELATFERNL